MGKVEVLRPVASFGEPGLSHLEFDKDISLPLEQYRAVYPFIVEFAQASNLRLIDVTMAYDQPEPIYIDYVHVSPQGHKYLVPILARALLSSSSRGSERR